jgi:hypothetical protein
MADTFTASLARLNGAERKAVKMTRNWNCARLPMGQWAFFLHRLSCSSSR